MPSPILATKLFIPLPRHNTVPRPRLVEKLNQGMQGKLTLISAPAGFGKTTLISEWIAGCGRPVAWLSLDEGDGDPARFLTYLVAALQTLKINFRKEVLDALTTSPSQPSTTESLLTEFLNEISMLSTNFILVLDDYHVIDSPPVDQTLTFLIDNQPAQMQLVIATREDPPFPLARLRMRGQLTELRAADLRFTPSEAADFLNHMMGLRLREADINALEARTEGWIAGLQLAALSMQGRADNVEFIKTFSGSHRFVVDYLVSEVLEHQTESVRNFLLETAILKGLNGALCDAVTGQVDSRKMLEILEQGNLFVVPLDDQRKWYRYHHLFSDVLQAHLIESYPERVADLHNKASEWYEHNGFQTDAIHHALAAENYDHAAGLIELIRPTMDLSFQSSTWLGWVKKIPDEIIRMRPVLSVGYAWALLDCGELEPSEARLLDAERCLKEHADKMIVLDDKQFRSLPATISTARAYRSLAHGNVADTIKYGRQALELIPEDDKTRYSEAISLLGLAQYTNGDLEEADHSLNDFYLYLMKTKEMVTLIGITFLMADIKVALGSLHDAESTYQKTLRFATNAGEPLSIGAADLYRGLGELYVQWNDLEKASNFLQMGQKIGEQAELTDWKYRLYLSQACLKEAQGDLEGALVLIDEAERVHIRDPLPVIRAVGALRAGVWLKQGKLAEAKTWVSEQGLSANGDLSYIREFEYITLVRVLIIAGKNDRDVNSLEKANRLLERLLQFAENGHRWGSVIQILVLQALLYQEQDKLSDALISLDRTLSMAEPQGYIRIFVDEGEPMRLLIEKVLQKTDHPLYGYLMKLMAAFDKPVEADKAVSLRQNSNMVEPLSERELEVLKLLRSEMAGPEIAQQLIVSLNTFRTHTKNIFTKLGVNNRRSAIKRAEELDLF